MFPPSHPLVLGLFLPLLGAAGREPVNAAAAPRSDAAQLGAPVESGPYVEGELLVVWHPGTTESQKALARWRIGATCFEDVTTKAMQAVGYGELERVHLPSGLSPFQAIEALRRTPAVRLAEPNWTITLAAQPSQQPAPPHVEGGPSTWVIPDPLYRSGDQWGMCGDATWPVSPFGCQAGEAWAAGHTGSSNIYVGVVDTGIQWLHPDLFSNIFVNPFDPINGIDDDGNGRVDDLRGWDFWNNDNTTYDGVGDAHGTHVAGTIGAVGGNDLGGAGVCWRVKLIPIKFGYGSSASVLGAALGMDYLTDLKNRHGLNIVSANNSWGDTNFSQLLFDAFARANSAGILSCAAAQNSGVNIDVTPVYPAAFAIPGILSVTAISGTGAQVYNYGANNVDLGAPGLAIRSTYPVGGYLEMNGTSMATPHVTGACALYLSTHPGATAAQIKSAILGSTIPTASLAGKCVTGGRLNVGGF